MFDIYFSMFVARRSSNRTPLTKLTNVPHQAYNGYERLIFPAMCRPDVCYHLNVALLGSGYPHAAVNAAVEESTISMRNKQLLEQDQVSSSLILSCQ